MLPRTLIRACGSLSPKLCRNLSLRSFFESSPVLISSNKNVYTNLALEHLLYNDLRFQDGPKKADAKNTDTLSRPVVLIWTDEPCVVIGRHQNPWIESNLGYLNKAGIKLARRHSGGGCVFHDENNINISIIDHRGAFENRQSNLRFLADFLDSNYRIKCEPTSRHDLIHIDSGHKLTGSAAKLGRYNCYHHFTLLVNTNKDTLHSSIRQTQQDFIDTNSTSSVRSQVINLADIKSDIEVDQVISDLAIAYGKHYNVKETKAQKSKAEIDSATGESLKKYHNELESWNWVYGMTPKFKLQRIMPVNDKGEEKIIKFEVTINKGLIGNIEVEGLGADQNSGVEAFRSLVGSRFTYNETMINLSKLLQSDETSMGVEKVLDLQLERWEKVVSSQDSLETIQLGDDQDQDENKCKYRNQDRDQDNDKESIVIRPIANNTHRQMRYDNHIGWLNRFLMNSCKVMCMEQKGDADDNSQSAVGDELETSTFSNNNNTNKPSIRKFSNKMATNLGPNNGQIISKSSGRTVPTASTSDQTSERAFDLVIFAASSSTGRFLVEESALVVDKYYSNHQPPHSPVTSSAFIREHRNPLQYAQRLEPSSEQKSIVSRKLSVPRQVERIKWAVAGRSAMRLNETLCRAELSTGIKNISNEVPVILADLNHHKSLLDMCAKTRLVINCAGPYSVQGEAVIKACLETRTNYIDLCHESTFIERIRRDYHERAKREGVYIINGCGFQSMSAEMGLNFMKQVADGQIDEVKIILNLNETKAIAKHSSGQQYPCGIVTPGMWSSLISERACQDKTNAISNQQASDRDKSKPKIEPTKDSQIAKGRDKSRLKLLLRKDTQTLVRDIVQLRNRASFGWLQLFKGIDQAGKGYCLPMNTVTSEESQLIRGEMNNYELRKPDLDSNEGWRPIRCSSYLSSQTLKEVIIVGNVNVVDSTQLDRDSLNHIKFCQTYLAYGTPSDDSGDPLEQREKDQKRKRELILVSRVVGPEPNHVATASYAVQAALTVLVEQDHLPGEGGVITPGAAFSETNIIYQLRRRNIKFEVLKKA